jgi:SNF2 family DNA or RNA helicase
MDGHATYNARAKMVNTFNTDPTIRVLFFTSVGASGLNLTKASVVIFLVRTLDH